MKKYLFPLLMLLTFASQAQTDEHYVDYEDTFEEGSRQRLYGDRVVLRKSPSSEAVAIDTLAIGTEITILNQRPETVTVNGREGHWYEVKYGRKKGFIAGGLIALTNVEKDGKYFLVIRAGSEEYTKVRCRVLQPDGTFYGHESDLPTLLFSLEVYGNRGIEGVENVVCINLMAEACGVDGGEIYLFSDGTSLKEAMHTAKVVDGGVFWFDETLIFPDEERTYDGAFLYEREFGEPMDEDMNWTRAVTHTVGLRWENGRFTPDISKFDFGEE